MTEKNRNANDWENKKQIINVQRPKNVVTIWHLLSCKIFAKIFKSNFFFFILGVIQMSLEHHVSGSFHSFWTESISRMCYLSTAVYTWKKLRLSTVSCLWSLLDSQCIGAHSAWTLLFLWPGHDLTSQRHTQCQARSRWQSRPGWLILPDGSLSNTVSWRKQWQSLLIGPSNDQLYTKIQ